MVIHCKNCLSVVFVLFLSIFVRPVLAQTIDAPRDTAVRLAGVPVLFYTPDTYWGFGAAGILTFRGYPLRSSVNFSFVYTQRNQLVVGFPYQWFHRKGRWRAFGEIGWYRYLYQYFGIGNQYPNDYIELYTAQYPKVRLNLLHKLGWSQLAGIRYSMDAFHIIESDPKGEIGQGLVRGAKGGFSSGLGPLWLFDTRDNQFFPRRGVYAEVFVMSETALTRSDFNYMRLSVDLAGYRRLPLRSVLAAQYIAVFSIGDPPFFLLPQMGGARRMRGYPDGKFRDRHMMLLQAEWRVPLVWRFKGVMFTGIGAVFGTAGQLPVLRRNAGIGLRFEFDRLQSLHLRLDYGIGKGSKGFYVTFGEAF